MLFTSVARGCRANLGDAVAGYDGVEVVFSEFFDFKVVNEVVVFASGKLLVAAENAAYDRSGLGWDFRRCLRCWGWRR